MKSKIFKKNYLSTLIASTLMVTVLSACNESNTDSDSVDDVTYTLQLLHMADMDGSNAIALANAGNFASTVSTLRNVYPENTLFLSSGDNYIPGARYEAGNDASMSQVSGVNVPGNGRADIAMLNAMGLQASAVGNHDLDGGTEEFASIIAVDDTYLGAQFPYLSSNMVFADDTNTAPLVVEDGQTASTIPNSLASTTIIEVNGERIGIVGATTPTNEVITSTGDITVLPANDSTVELAAIIQTKVDELTATGINKIILLAHMQTISIEKQLATLLNNVDIIVAGGSNTLLADSTDRQWAGDTVVDNYPLLLKSATDEDVALVNVDGDYKYLGRLVVGFNADGELITSSIDEDESGSYITDDTMVTSLSANANADVDAIVDAVNDIIVAAESNILGHTTVFLNGTKSEVRSEETNLGNLTAEANLWYAKLADSSVQVSIKNGGGIRADIGYAAYPAGSTSVEDLIYYPPAAYPNAGKEAGDISQYDLQSSLAFNNSLSTLAITASELKEILEHTVSDIDVTDATGYGGGKFPQIAGMQFTFDATLTAAEYDADTGALITAGLRVTTLSVDTDGDGTFDDVVVENGSVQGDDSRSFNMVTLSYLGTGGDGYPFPCIDDSCSNQTQLESNMGANDPGLASFATDGTEQDALAEYLLQSYPDIDNAYAEKDSIEDSTIVDMQIIRTN
jgi:2',3'-cyclic-nucleotide 2'-phosphodiesterase (5'-nucleotidase family)